MSLANIVSRSLRLTRPETVAISIECCYQNTAIATSVAVTMFSDPTERAEAVSVPLFYGVVEAVIIGIYCLWAWKVGWTKAPADEKVCTTFDFFASNSL
jgi:predicted Na+-dependent transporter